MNAHVNELQADDDHHHSDNPDIRRAKTDYEREVKARQAQYLKDLQLALAKPPPDPLRAQRVLFLMTLINARHVKGLSQAGLASRLGLHQSSIARIESGRGNPTLNTLLAIARTLEINLVVE